MRVDYLIVGQGISGTWLSYFLSKEPVSCFVIDNGKGNASSRVAAGLINPVTGRRVVKTWMIDTLLPFAKEMYETVGQELDIKAISQKNIIDFFSAPDVKIAFEKRIQEGESFVSEFKDASLEKIFHPDFGCGMIAPAYTAHLENLLPAWRQELIRQNRFSGEEFLFDQLSVHTEHILYQQVEAKKIIFCDGHAGAASPYFSRLPFALHKGEALLLEIKDLPPTHIYKKGLSLVPMRNENLFWLGSNYIWEFENDHPTAAFRQEAEQKLKNWLKLPYRMVDHKAAVRPANVERRPFVGMHPVYKNVGIFNGMGTKGCSLAPYFAKQFAAHLVHEEPLLPEVDITRFQKILSRS